MKKWMKCLLLIFVMVMCVPVFAVERQRGEVIPASESATVYTDLFTYTDMSYSPSVAGKDYGRFSFKSITNVSTKSVPISIDILLFDSKLENIGFVTYCTDQDFGGEFAQKKLGSNATTSFYINVTSRYFVADKGPSDVMYYSVFDENEYCHVGGYDKYAGLTMEEIASGIVVKNSDSENGIPSISFDTNTLMNYGSTTLMLFGIIIVVSIILIIIQGLILNALHQRMFGDTTILAYIPIANQYIAVKLAFGGKVAGIFVIVLILSLFLTLIVPIIPSLVSLVSSAAFIIDILKLITKNYKMCYLEPLNNSDGVDLDHSVSVEVAEEHSDEEEEDVVSEEESTEGETDESSEGESTGVEDSILNLNYGTDSTPNFTETQDNMDSSTMDNQDLKAQENVKEGESDLMNLFK